MVTRETIRRLDALVGGLERRGGMSAPKYIVRGDDEPPTTGNYVRMPAKPADMAEWLERYAPGDRWN
jgi:hypothetical protein